MSVCQVVDCHSVQINAPSKTVFRKEVNEVATCAPYKRLSPIAALASEYKTMVVVPNCVAARPSTGMVLTGTSIPSVYVRSINFLDVVTPLSTANDSPMHPSRH